MKGYIVQLDTLSAVCSTEMQFLINDKSLWYSKVTGKCHAGFRCQLTEKYKLSVLIQFVTIMETYGFKLSLHK